MSRRRPRRAPCAAHPRAAGGDLVHPEGSCACFRGGPAPVLAPNPELVALADRPGVFDTSWIGQPTEDEPKRRRPMRAWLRRITDR
jgi:hypothetical protein